MSGNLNTMRKLAWPILTDLKQEAWLLRHHNHAPEQPPLHLEDRHSVTKGQRILRSPWLSTSPICLGGSRRWLRNLKHQHAYVSSVHSPRPPVAQTSDW